MNRPSTGFEIHHSTDFEQVYNLDDPAPYYAHLAGCDYQMPSHLADWLATHHTQIRMARAIADDQPLRVLDLACGFGFNGALLQHDISLSDVYGRYAARPWLPDRARGNWAADASYFAASRRAGNPMVLSGIDIAPVAVEYALATGLIDVGFTDDLVAGLPGQALHAHLQTIDVVIESGAIGSIYADCFGRMLDAVDESRNADARPWFVYCPRPNVDRRPIDALWRQRGYSDTTCSPPLKYRQPIGDLETQMVLEQTSEAGNDPATALVNGYLAVEMRLARPASD